MIRHPLSCQACSGQHADGNFASNVPDGAARAGGWLEVAPLRQFGRGCEVTVLVEQYWREISAGLAQHAIPVRHFVLHADHETLRRRIAEAGNRIRFGSPAHR